MQSKTLTIVVSSLIAIFLLVAIDQVGCLLRSCSQNDDASIRAQVFIVPMYVLYALLSWLSVFPAIIALGKRMPKPIASLIVSFLSGFMVAFLLHRPTIDGSFTHTATILLPWLIIPWFIAGWVATVMWPNPSFKRDALKRAR